MEVLVCDDHQLLAELVATVLTERGHAVRVAPSPPEALEVVRSTPVDVCLMDLGFPDRGSADALGPLEGIAAIAAEGVRVIVLSGSGESVRRAEALRAGASRYLIKGDPIAYVIRAVEHPEESDRRTRSCAPPRPDAWTYASLASFLTPRERAVLDGLVAGESTKELAARLGVRPATARTHVQNLLGKLCVHSRVEAVVLAVEHGLVEVRDPSVDGQERR